MDVKDIPSQFLVNNLMVDMETGKIINDGTVQVVEPKVMALLKVLAQSPQQVISAEKLFEIVWPGSIYSPNSVRRNIALLRQAMSDDDKQIIKTHPKRGYSLNADIRYSERNFPISPKGLVDNNAFKWLSSFIVFIFIAGLVFTLYNFNESLSLANLTPITASNEQERYMQVSPDGRFMAYIQNTHIPNERNLLIKDLVTESHWTLTNKQRAYTYLAWDAHVNGLVYSFKDKQGISFRRILLNSQAKVVKEEPLFTRNDITWNSLFFIDKRQNLYYLANHYGSEHSQNVSLYKYNLITEQAETLLPPNDSFKPYKLALSPDQTQLALIGFNKEAVSEVKLLDLFSNKLTFVGLIDHNWHFLTWLENGQHLLLSNGNEFKRLTLNGEMNKLNYSTFNFLIYPQVLNDKVYFIEAQSDQDILTTDIHSLALPIKHINSNTIDTNAQLSPDESRIAYMSMKNGFPQLFVKYIDSGKEQLLLGNSKQELALIKPIWHKSGKRLISSINNKPFIIQFEKSQFSIKWLDTVIGRPIAWYNHSDAILFVDKRTHNDQLIKYDVKTNSSVSLKMSLKRRMFFLNHQDQLFSFLDGKIVNHTMRGEDQLDIEEKVINVFPTVKGFYYLYMQSNQTIIDFYDYELGIQSLGESFHSFCADYCNRITSIKANTILLKEQSNSADVLTLDIHNVKAKN